MPYSHIDRRIRARSESAGSVSVDPVDLPKAKNGKAPYNQTSGTMNEKERSLSNIRVEDPVDDKELMSFSERMHRTLAAVNPLHVFYMVLNVASSIGIVFVNKWVYENYGFKYATTLTLVHFVVTFIGLHICSLFGMFAVKSLDAKTILKDVCPLCLSFCGFVVLTNISLRYNSVGFYQIAKVMTTPVIMVIQSYLYNVTFEWTIKMSLVPVCIGVIVTTATDVKLNLKGTIYAAVAVLITSQYQIWVGTKQKELKLSSPQLLWYQAPISACMLLFFIPFLDDIWGPEGLKFYVFTTPAMMFIMLSGVIAFLVNLSIFLVIGKTSPVTYNVLGHFKLTMVIIGGFLIFGDPVRWKNLMGICITLVGIVWYTQLKMEQQRIEAEAKRASEVKDVKLESAPPEKSPMLRSRQKPEDQDGIDQS